MANRYHAFGLAMNQMRRCSGNDQKDAVDKMVVEWMNTRWRKLVVKRKQFEVWIGTPEDALRKGDQLKLHLLMLLKRMPPDREFQRWLQRQRD